MDTTNKIYEVDVLESTPTSERSTLVGKILSLLEMENLFSISSKDKIFPYRSVWRQASIIGEWCYFFAPLTLKNTKE